MNKEKWERCKKAYLMTINGCGSNCLECPNDDCICDSKTIRADARLYVKQKKAERLFYNNNRLARIQAVKEAYKKKPDPWACRRLSADLINLLPESFSYEEAAKIWCVEYGCAVERLKKFLKKGKVEKKRVAVKGSMFRSIIIFNKITTEKQTCLSD